MTHPTVDVGTYILAKPPLAEVDATVATARDWGSDSLFVWDHILDFYSSANWDQDFTWMASRNRSPHEWLEFQTLLGYLAAKNPDMRVGVGVTESIRRHPAVIAQAALTLAHMSHRAPILGMGAGEVGGSTPYGLDFSGAVSRLEEALQIIRLYFDTDGPVTFNGRYFQLEDSVVDLRPPENRKPELWVAAHGPRMLELTGRYGDGWYPVLTGSPENYAGGLEVIRASAKNAGRNPDAITPAMHTPTVIGQTEADVRELKETRAVRFWGLILSDAVWQMFGLRHPLGENHRGYLDLLPEKYDRETFEAAIDAVPPEILDLFFCGTPDQLVESLRAYGRAGLRHFVPVLISSYASPDAAAYSIEAMAGIAGELRNGA